jgi:uncharacterized protein (UPF0548 family)
MILMPAWRARYDNLGVREAEWESHPLTGSLGERARHHDCYTRSLAAKSADEAALVWTRAADALMRYDIYPPRRMRARVCTPEQRVHPGCLIVQRIIVGPLAMEAAVRVVDVFASTSGAPRQGFSYGTLDGHAERGVATFSVEIDPARQVVFKIESWSSPADRLARLMAPLSRCIQQQFTQEALDHFAEVVSGS